MPTHKKKTIKSLPVQDDRPTRGGFVVSGKIQIQGRLRSRWIFRGLAKNLRFVCRDRQKGRRMTEQSPKLCYNKLLESFMYLEDLYGREKYRGHRI